MENYKKLQFEMRYPVQVLEELEELEQEPPPPTYREALRLMINKHQNNYEMPNVEN